MMQLMAVPMESQSVFLNDGAGHSNGAINEYLKDGWKVTHMVSFQNRGGVEFIVVFQRPKAERKR